MVAIVEAKLIADSMSNVKNRRNFVRLAKERRMVSEYWSMDHSGLESRDRTDECTGFRVPLMMQRGIMQAAARCLYV
jgi:hypothetical protein